MEEEAGLRQTDGPTANDNEADLCKKNRKIFDTKSFNISLTHQHLCTVFERSLNDFDRETRETFRRESAI